MLNFNKDKTMKKGIIYIITTTILGLGVVSCSQDLLDTNPTTSMSPKSLFATPTAALVPLNGIYRSMYTAGWSTTANTHQCFGISAYNLMAEVMGDDFIMEKMGSGWFWFDAKYNVKSRYTSTAWRSWDLWNAYYTWIANANYIIASEDVMNGKDEEKNYVIGQAYAIRAYSYFCLAQTFARTYKGHETNPCVPIYTKPTVAGTEGKARSTVQEVYTQITDDINKAVAKLKGTTNKSKSHMGYTVANGIKARIALVMEDWSTALAAATEARIGTSIANKDDILDGFNKVSAKNVIWGAEIIDDQTGSYASFFTHMNMGTTDANGKALNLYADKAPKAIAKNLYNTMMNADVRKTGWWNSNRHQIKFRFKDVSKWSGDYIWMRNEEMVLIQAEAECRLSHENKAKEYLAELMNKRLDVATPNYTTPKTGTELGALTTDMTGSLLEEILIQRRIELWGEAGRVYDIRRLKQGFTRTIANGWSDTDILLKGVNTQNPETYAWVLTIPQKEFDGNVNMDAKTDQNPIGDTK